MVTLMNGSEVAPVLRQIVGQPRATEILSASVAKAVHAYLFIGPAGSGKLLAAQSFAAALLCELGGCGDCASCHDAQLGLHPDITVFEREGASITVDEAHAISLVAQRSPNVSTHQVLILTDFHLVGAAAPALLKTIEEPPPSTIFIVIADALPASLVTISSRCVLVPFHSLRPELIAEVLRAEGIEEDLASSVANASLGDLDRARLLVSDQGFRLRQSQWSEAPQHLDGTGASVAKIVTQLTASVDEIVNVLRDRQSRELERAVELSKLTGERSLRGRKAIEDRHKREQRRVRTDELRAGLATLISVYLAKLSSPQLPTRRVQALTEACQAIDEAAKYLKRNPNEILLLQKLFLQLGDLAS